MTTGSGVEPTMEEIKQFMQEHDVDYYTAREHLRELAYGGPPPDGYESWGDYWKTY